MKKRFARHIPLIFLIAIGFLPGQAVKGMCGSTVLWHNLSDGPGGNSAGVTENVIDENIDIIGTNALVGGILVNAIDCDVLITVTNEDSVITGSGNRSDGQPVGEEPRLYLFAETDRTITFSLTEDLLFRGTSDQGALVDLLVSVSGGGEVRFCIDDNQVVSFTSQPDSGATLLVLGMDDPNNPRLVFKRLDSNGQGNVEVVVGDRSCITYIAESSSLDGSTEEGCIAFDPSNTGTGCTILRLQNNSSFIIWGHTIQGGPVSDGLEIEFTISDISFDSPAGLQAKFVIENSTAGGDNDPAPLQIINENCVLTDYVADPFCDNAFTGTQKGFVLGSFGKVQLNDITYLDYIGTKTNTVPDAQPDLDEVQQSVLDLIACGDITGANALIKERNASAFIVDGIISNPDAINPQICMFGSSAIYFRSGVDCSGQVNEPSFVINPALETAGAGNIVFDVEAPLDILGDSNGNNALSVLSLQVTKTGCPVFVESDETQFPQRTFARSPENLQLLQYNKGAWLINNQINLNDASIVHTDEIHNVYQQGNLGRSDLSSEPTYIGGETFKLCLPDDQPRPAISFVNAVLRVHTSIGLTGFDLCIPNNDDGGNSSIFRFYNNGRAIDNGYGRVAVLGTNEGSLSACGLVIDNNVYLDVFQKSPQAIASEQLLALDTGANDECITEGLTEDIDGQCAVQSIFMNNKSNIQVGTNGEQGIDSSTGLPFDLVTTPSLCINGAFFSFDTAGGQWALPCAGGTTGQGAIFVDKNGTFKIQPNLRASFSSMVARSRNGVIDLPKNQVFFGPRVGITQWNIDLEDEDQRILVPADQCLSEFTLDWGAVQKDYASSNSFVPYDPKEIPSVCQCPPVTSENLRALPIVEGTVEQFNIKRSRIGDQASLLVRGGQIGELVFLQGCNPGEFPGGFLVVEDNANVGISTAHKDVDSLQASVKLGLNGLMICANGEATITLNEDVVVDNVCPILTGTSFGLLAPQALKIYALDEKEFRVKRGGVLDLSQFDEDGKILEFAGKIRLIFEPGSSLVLGGGTLTFTDRAVWTFERVLNPDLFTGSVPSDLDSIRAKLVGSGIIVMEEFSAFNLFQDQFFGIETDPSCTNITTITWLLNDCASINIGTACEPGGAFQIGDTECRDGAEVNVNFVLNGFNARLAIEREGFFGLGVGIADKSSRIPNLWLVNCLENVNNLSFDIQQGIFDHRRISTGDSAEASLLAIGQSGIYSYIYDQVQAIIRGGGNIVLISNCLNDECNELLRSQEEPLNMSDEGLRLLAQARMMMTEAERIINDARIMMEKNSTRGSKPQFKEWLRRVKSGNNLKLEARSMVRSISIPSINPVVQSVNGVINDNLSVGMFGGKLIWRGSANRIIQPVNVAGADLFSFLVTDVTSTMPNPRGNFAENMVNSPLIGLIDNAGIIRREIENSILGTNGFNDADPGYSLGLGAVNYNLDDSSMAVNSTIEIRGAGSE